MARTMTGPFCTFLKFGYSIRIDVNRWQMTEAIQKLWESEKTTGIVIY